MFASKVHIISCLLESHFEEYKCYVNIDLSNVEAMQREMGVIIIQDSIAM